MVGYYDVILGLIPVTGVSVAALLATFGVALSTAVAIGAGLTVPLVAHALFVRAPVGHPPNSDDAAHAEQETGSMQTAD